MALFPLIIAALLQTGGQAPGTYQQSGQFTAPGGRVVLYDSYTVNSNGTITYNLTGGGSFTTPVARPNDPSRF